MKVKRRDVNNMLSHIQIQDLNGAIYTDKVRGAITALDFHLSEESEKISAYYKKVEAEAAKALKIPETKEARSEEDQQLLDEYIDNHAEFTKFIDTKIVIPVTPIKLADLSKCKYLPSVFRSWYNSAIVA